MDLRGDFPSPALSGSGTGGRRPVIAFRPLSLPAGPLAGFGFPVASGVVWLPRSSRRHLQALPAVAALSGPNVPFYRAIGPSAPIAGGHVPSRSSVMPGSSCHWWS